MLRIIRQAFRDWMDDDCPRMAAALSYYTIFSLPPLLLIVLTVTGAVAGSSSARDRIVSEMSSLLGPEAAGQVEAMLQNASLPSSGGPVMAALGIAALIFGATSAFAQLQGALNRAWEVQPDPDRGGLKVMLRKRVVSLGMVLTIGFLLLVSLVLSAALSAFGEQMANWLPAGISDFFLRWAEVGLSLLVFPILFALIFKILPDAEVAWRDVAAGAIATAVLFIFGKFLLGLYFGRADPGQAYGAAGSLAVILLWVYVSSMIFLFGAELTQAWAAARGRGIEPEKGAVRVIEEKRVVRSGQTTGSGDSESPA